MTPTTDALVQTQDSLLRDLGEVDRQLRARNYLSSNIDTMPECSLARFLVDLLVDRGYDPGQLSSVSGWVHFHTERHIRTEALRQAEWDVTQEADAKIMALKTAKVVP